MLHIEKLNESTLRITSNDYHIEQELCDHFKFRPEGYQFMPAYKSKVWDGYVAMYDIHRKHIAYGLLDYVRDFAKHNEYEITETDIDCGENITLEQIQTFCESLNIHSNNKKIELRDYQIDAVYQAIKRGRMLALSPTASGKSVIIYCYLRWHLNHARRIILLVPSTSLVLQLFNDFKDYSTHNNWCVDEYVHCLYSGKDKTFDKPMCISTWQSILSMLKNDKNVKSFMKLWDVYIGDEAHQFASTSLLKISNNLINAKYRLGTTGTIHDKNVSKLSIEGSFGAVYKVITTKELMDAGQVVNLKIKCIVFDHDKEVKKLMKNVDYKGQLDFIISHDKRNKFIARLSNACNGNTLVLYNFVDKHGKPLYELCQSVCKDKIVYFISGEIDVEEREKIRTLLSTHDNAVLVASYKTLSTGVNIPSIENIIFASPFKSKIRNLQSIGRGLRLKNGKTKCQLFDFADNLTNSKSKNYSMLHLDSRMKDYSSEQFDFTIQTVTL